jgi:hypothetical protein
MEELLHEHMRNLLTSSSTFLQLQPILLEYSKAQYSEMSAIIGTKTQTSMTTATKYKNSRKD